MSANMGNIDRVIRLLIGIAAIALVLAGPLASSGWGWERIALAIVGTIMVLTSAVKFCPLYRVFGLRTCKDG
jgi:fatty acid desaturase